MSDSSVISKENIDFLLNELGKEYKRLSGRKTPAEVILVGGASIVATHHFRNSTTDFDAIIKASSYIKDAINNIGERYNLPDDWMNQGFIKTKSYSNKLYSCSKYYKTFANLLEVRIIPDEYLIAMKLISGREYKHDLSDVVGIITERKESNSEISKDMIDSAINYLYGGWNNVPSVSIELYNKVFEVSDLRSLYDSVKKNESQIRTGLIKATKDMDTSKKLDINSVVKKIKQYQEKESLVSAEPDLSRKEEHDSER